MPKAARLFGLWTEEGGCLAKVAPSGLQALYIVGNVQISTQALCELLKAGVSVVYLSRNGRLLGAMRSPLSRNILLRRSQYAREANSEFQLKMAKAVIHAKILNCVTLLKTARSSGLATDELRSETASKLVEFAKSLQNVKSSESLLGVEGSAAKCYWATYGKMFRDDAIRMKGRALRPPPDPVNAALSFGYVLLTSKFTSLIEGYGFDPYLGFYHKPAYGRPSLALDLLEPFRPYIVDRFVKRLFNLRILRTDDFEPHDEGGVRMSQEALRTFFYHWDKNLTATDATDRFNTLADSLRKVFADEADEPHIFTWDGR
ncbi:MAG: CRISPR-associated endonuclease Cas1 [Planctomycetota bacterium]|nr:CRISPR-associated endonuclease Cas1 [Planctomycetota bacterium]